MFSQYHKFCRKGYCVKFSTLSCKYEYIADICKIWTTMYLHLYSHVNWNLKQRRSLQHLHEYYKLLFVTIYIYLRVSQTPNGT